MKSDHRSKKVAPGNLLLILLILLGVSLGCLGPSADDSKCEGVVKSDGQSFVGRAKDENQAGLNACNKFCLEKDSEFDAMYGIWLTSDQAKDLEKRKGRKPTKEDAIYEDKKLLDYVTKNCAVRCVKEANQSKHTLETKCEN